MLSSVKSALILLPFLTVPQHESGTRKTIYVLLCYAHPNIKYFWFYLNQTTKTCMDWVAHQAVLFKSVDKQSII